VRSSSAGFAGMMRSSRAQANSRRRTAATVLLVPPEAVPLGLVSDEVARRHVDEAHALGLESAWSALRLVELV
jgi:hypothetical protein